MCPALDAGTMPGGRAVSAPCGSGRARLTENKELGGLGYRYCRSVGGKMSVCRLDCHLNEEKNPAAQRVGEEPSGQREQLVQRP